MGKSHIGTKLFWGHIWGHFIGNSFDELRNHAGFLRIFD